MYNTFTLKLKFRVNFYTHFMSLEILKLFSDLIQDECVKFHFFIPIFVSLGPIVILGHCN